MLRCCMWPFFIHRLVLYRLISEVVHLNVRVIFLFDLSFSMLLSKGSVTYIGYKNTAFTYIKM